MRCFVMFVTAVFLLFLSKLIWPKNKSFTEYIYFFVMSYQYIVETSSSKLKRKSAIYIC